MCCIYRVVFDLHVTTEHLVLYIPCGIWFTWNYRISCVVSTVWYLIYTYYYWMSSCNVVSMVFNWHVSLTLWYSCKIAMYNIFPDPHMHSYKMGPNHCTYRLVRILIGINCNVHFHASIYLLDNLSLTIYHCMRAESTRMLVSTRAGRIETITFIMHLRFFP